MGSKKKRGICCIIKNRLSSITYQLSSFEKIQLKIKRIKQSATTKHLQNNLIAEHFRNSKQIIN